MGVYIDREEAIKCLDGSVLITRHSEAEAVRKYFEMVIKRLENLPTIDLVRCGECKWWDSDDGNIGYCHAEKHCYRSKNWEIDIHRTYKKDHYCSDGNRKEKYGGRDE